MPKLQKLILSLILGLNLFAGNGTFGENTDSQNQTAKESGLAAYYNFDEGKGNEVCDVSGNGNTGKISGKADWKKVTDDFEVQMFGYGLEMSSQVNCGNGAGLDMKGNALTVETWFKTGSDSTCIPLVNKFVTDWKTKYRGYSLNIEKNGCIRLWLGFGKSGQAFDTPKVLAPYTFYHVIAVYDGSFVKIYLNGKMLATIPESRTIESSIGDNLYIGEKGSSSTTMVDAIKIYDRAFNAAQVKAAFDADKKQGRYKIEEAVLKDSSPNLLLNSSFKRCSNPGIPDWWGTGMAAFLKDWNDKIYGIDESVTPPVPGVKCLRLTAMPSGFWLNSTFPCFPGGKEYTFSVYLKAGEPGTKAGICVDQNGKHFNLTTEWQRCVVTGFQKAASLRDLCITVTGAGPVWVAAPQMEYGTQATAYQTADADNINNTTDSAILKSAACPRTDIAPKIDGIPDDACWEKAAVLDNFNILAGDPVSPETATTARMICDNKNLYISFLCNEPDMDKIKSREHPRDKAGIFNDDSVEIFISTNPDAAGYYQIAVNSMGSVFDAFSCNAGWNADLRCAAKKNRNNWTVEVEMPFASFNASTPEVPWRINLCRSRYAGKSPEYSSWSPINGNSFHTPERMGWLEGMVSSETQNCTVEKKNNTKQLSATTEFDYYTKDEYAELSIGWTQNYSADMEIVLKEKNSGMTYKPLAKAVSLRPATSTLVKLPLAGLPDGDYEITVNATAQGKEPLVATDNFRKLSPSANEFRANKQGRYLVENGKPVLLYGPVVCPGQWKNEVWQLDDIKAHGFNSIWLAFGHLSSKEQLDAREPSMRTFLDECAKRGLMVLIYMDISPNLDYPRCKEIAKEFVKRFKDHPAIAVWNFVDEPDLWWGKKKKESDLPDLYKTVKEIDPYRPAFINWCFWENSPYGSLAASDIASVDRYPLRYSIFTFNPEVISGLAESINRVSGTVGKPVNFFMQMQGYWDMAREPVPAEVRWMTYVNFIYGTRICQYFSYKPMSPVLWESMKTLGADLMNLFSIVTLPGAKEIASGKKGGMIYSVWDVSGRRIMIAANEKNKPAKVSLNFNALPAPEKAESGKPFAGMEKIELKDGILNFSMTPLQCGVYELISR